MIKTLLDAFQRGVLLLAFPLCLWIFPAFLSYTSQSASFVNRTSVWSLSCWSRAEYKSIQTWGLIDHKILDKKYRNRPFPLKVLPSYVTDSSIDIAFIRRAQLLLPRVSWDGIPELPNSTINIDYGFTLHNLWGVSGNYFLVWAYISPFLRTPFIPLWSYLWILCCILFSNSFWFQSFYLYVNEVPSLTATSVHIRILPIPPENPSLRLELTEHQFLSPTSFFRWKSNSMIRLPAISLLSSSFPC